MRWLTGRFGRGEAGVGVTFLAVVVVLCLIVAGLYIYRGTTGPSRRAHADSRAGTRGVAADRDPYSTPADRDSAIDRASKDGAAAGTSADAARAADAPSGLAEEWQERNVQRALTDMARLLEAIDTFRSVKGRNPTVLEELIAPLRGHMDGLLGPFGVPADPWGRDYVYRGKGGEPVAVWTLGSDGKQGGVAYAADLLGAR